MGTLLRAVVPALVVVALLGAMTPPASAAPLGQSDTYTVKPGDTLYKIWRATGTSVADLITLNGPTYPSLYSNPGLIFPGWVLRLLPGATVPASSPGDVTTYTVQRGDWIYKIARETGTSVTDLINLNVSTYPSLATNPSELHVGWVLRLPGGASGDVPQPAPVPEAPAPPPAAGYAERVLIISVDGLRPDALFATSAPSIIGLANRGTYTWNAQTVVPPTTLPANASMLSGVSVGRHGLTWNGYLPANGTIQVPTVFSVVHAAGGRTVMVISKEKLLHLAAPGSVDEVVTLTDQSDFDVSTRAVALIPGGFDLMFVHMLDVDDHGHTFGWMSPEYLSAVSRADEAVGRMLAALNVAGMAGTTVVIVTSDHGGSGTEHTADTPENRTIPWVIAGPGVRSGNQLATGVSTMDTAATVLFALGLEVPGDWQGRPVTEAFE